jgi:hypothetical protein
MPGAQCTRSLAWEMKNHTSIVTTVTPETPGIPRAMVLQLIRALPGDRAFLPPSFADRSTTLTPASGRQDHTTSPSAFASLALRHQHVHRIPHPTSVAIARTPLFRVRDGEN